MKTSLFVQCNTYGSAQVNFSNYPFRMFVLSDFKFLFDDLGKNLLDLYLSI